MSWSSSWIQITDTSGTSGKPGYVSSSTAGNTLKCPRRLVYIYPRPTSLYEVCNPSGIAVRLPPYTFNARRQVCVYQAISLRLSPTTVRWSPTVANHRRPYGDYTVTNLCRLVPFLALVTHRSYDRSYSGRRSQICVTASHFSADDRWWSSVVADNFVAKWSRTSLCLCVIGVLTHDYSYHVCFLENLDFLLLFLCCIFIGILTA